jgi:hypothetical protein
LLFERLMRLGIAVVLSFTVLAACSSSPDSSNPTTDNEALSGCHGQASSSVPSSGQFYLTTFGGPGEGQKMSCGQSTKNGTWYYAASRQRFGCGAHVQVQAANGKCVVVETDDYGPDVCVENRAGRPIIDASPLVSKYLFGASGAGWSDRLAITVTKVSSSTPLGPCKAQQSAPPPDPQDDSGDPPDPGPPPTPSAPPDQGTGSECNFDDDCNGGFAGTELICDQGECVPGCRIDDDCADSTAICIDGQCQ